jgi:hypothetical protein
MRFSVLRIDFFISLLHSHFFLSVVSVVFYTSFIFAVTQLFPRLHRDVPHLLINSKFTAKMKLIEYINMLKNVHGLVSPSQRVQFKANGEGRAGPIPLTDLGGS